MENKLIIEGVEYELVLVQRMLDLVDRTPRIIINGKTDLGEAVKTEKAKEWEILSFKQGPGVKDVWLPVPGRDGLWARDGVKTSPYTTEEILSNPLYSIHSVRRLSDNEVFDIGDKVKHKDGSYAVFIKKFVPQADGMWFVTTRAGGEDYKDLKNFTKNPRDWEVVTFKNDFGKYFCLAPGGYYEYTDDTKPERWRTEEWLLKCEYVKIHSVRRLSDGEVFTVGGPVSYGKNGIIRRFRVDEQGYMFCEVEFNQLVSQDNVPLSALDAVKQPLFKTEDGVDVYEGMKCWFVRDDLSYGVADAHGCKMWGADRIKYFSTKEAADEYVLMNKPCLSVADITKEFTNLFDNSKKRLKELAQSKLKTN
jgi:hypothetical protein